MVMYLNVAIHVAEHPERYSFEKRSEALTVLAKAIKRSMCEKGRTKLQRFHQAIYMSAPWRF